MQKPVTDRKIRFALVGCGRIAKNHIAAKADCVVLASPSGLHSVQATRVAAAGKHVMTEKPMATRWHDGLAMVKACDAADVRLFVVKQNRRNRTLQLLK
jgi:UDP-N-acetyl-2-amino-2-deoxyglucuronate dehydrogenase